jgi:hypothetical protein
MSGLSLDTHAQGRSACCFLLVAVVWIAFAQTFRPGFVNYNDKVYVYNDPKATNGFIRARTQ